MDGETTSQQMDVDVVSKTYWNSTVDLPAIRVRSTHLLIQVSKERKRCKNELEKKKQKII